MQRPQRTGSPAFTNGGGDQFFPAANYQLQGLSRKQRRVKATTSGQPSSMPIYLPENSGAPKSLDSFRPSRIINSSSNRFGGYHNEGNGP